MTVKDVMTSRIVSVSPDECIANVAKMMSRHDVGVIPVVENEKVCGVITDRDIVLRCIAKDKDCLHSKAGEVMSESAACISPGQSLADAMQMMSAHQVRRLPVTENGKVTGIVSLSDIARIRSSAEIAKTLTEISMP